MKAVVYQQYGSPEELAFEERPMPVPKPDEVIIKVHATTVTAADCMMRRGDAVSTRLVLGLFRPRKRYRVLGLELAGEVVKIGGKVTRFRVGDRVFGFTGFALGAHATYCCLKENASLARMPESLSFEEAAAMVDGVTTAIFFLQDKAKLRPGERVLIIGASGSIGTAAVQWAAHRGAEVTAVCSGANAAFVKSLGAAKTVDYTKEDATKGDEVYDVVFDTVGKSSFGKCKSILTKNGRYMTTVGTLGVLAAVLFTALRRGKRCLFGLSVEKRDALEKVERLVSVGAMQPVIGRRFPLDRIAEAHQYADTGRKRGNAVVLVPHNA